MDQVEQVKEPLPRIVAEQLGWHLLDSGAIYRVLAVAAEHHNITADDEESLLPISCALRCAISNL